MNEETQTQKLFRLWHGPFTNEEIAEELGVSRSKLGALARQHKLKPRANTIAPIDNENPRPGDPTPEEILAGIAAVQADWNEDERLKRYRGKRRVAYIAPAYAYDGRTTSFNNLN